MGFFAKTKESPHYSQLKDSLECRHAKKQFILVSVFVGILMVPLVLLFSLACDNPADTAIAVAMDFFLILLVLGIWLYMGYQWLEIFLHMDSYIFFQAKLDQPHLEYSRYGSRVRFTVEFTNCRGKQLKRDTGALFSSHAELYLEDYNNQTVLIGYNEETDRIVIIERLDV